MKVASKAVAILMMLLLSYMIASGPQAQAYDPRAQVPGATITGVILDANGNSVPNATVRLLMDGQLFDVPGNPQQSNAVAGPNSAVGRYLFMRLPYGEFLVTAETPDAAGTIHRSNLTVSVDANTVTADIVLSDLVVSSTGLPASPASPTPGHEPCIPGLVLPVLGLCGLVIYSRRLK